MANINDYLLWRGDIPISSQFEFNEVDSMILARFSYLLFDKITMDENETIASISQKMQNIPNEEFLYNGDKELITYLGQSNRFKDMVVTDYIHTHDKNLEEQFCAITIHISNSEIYISYIGTDTTIYGWKENFNMSFMDNVPCQIAGRDYADRIAKKYPSKKIRIGGHSKGGNVAIYSAITLSPKIQKRIIKVYNYDGPGFSKNIIDKYGNDSIINKIETYIPQDSIIGRVLNHKEKIKISLSNEKGIFQHDIYSWQVLKDDLIELNQNTETSENIDKTLSNWLENTSAEQRKIFIDTVFELFYSTDANTFGEISENLSANILKMLKKYRKLSANDKKTISKMIKILINSYFKIVKEKKITKLGNLREQYINKGKLKLQKFDEKLKMNLFL